MALLNGVRVVLAGSSPTLLLAGPAVQGFLSLNSSGVVNGFTYQWVLECNFATSGAATDREGGSGDLQYFGWTPWRVIRYGQPRGNAQIAIIGLTHMIVTPMAPNWLQTR